MLIFIILSFYRFYQPTKKFTSLLPKVYHFTIFHSYPDKSQSKLIQVNGMLAILLDHSLLYNWNFSLPNLLYPPTNFTLLLEKNPIFPEQHLSGTVPSRFYNVSGSLTMRFGYEISVPASWPTVHKQKKWLDHAYIQSCLIILATKDWIYSCKMNWFRPWY